MAKTEKTEASTNEFFDVTKADVTKAFGDVRLPGLDVQCRFRRKPATLSDLMSATLPA
jgi:hypothetical protein